MKKADFYKKSEMLYVESGLTLARISEINQVSSRTLQEWKKEGNWDDKRNNFIRLQNSCSASLYKMLKNMTDIVNTQMDRNENPDMAMVAAIERLSKSIAKIKPVEKENIQEQTQLTESQNPTEKEDLATKISEIADAKFTGKF